MKLKKILLMAAVLCSMVPSFAKPINDAEKAAQKAMYEYLVTNRYLVEIDDRDQSVNFKKGDILYWITFEGNSSRMLYTLHRKNIRFDNDKDSPERIGYRCEIAERVANKLSASNPYKAFMKGSRVHFQFPVYATSAKEYQQVFPKVLASMQDIKSDFDANYKRCTLTVDSIHNYWLDKDTVHRVVPQRLAKEAKSRPNVTISSIAARNITSSGEVISGYNQGLRKNKCRYIQVAIEATSDKAGVYKIGLKIVTPDGKILVPSKDARFSTVTTIDVKKANKPERFELVRFGTDGDDLWEAGEYKLYFYEDDSLIYEDALNIL